MRYIQLEKGESIAKDEIIGIFDIEVMGNASGSKEFFRRNEDERSVISLSNDLPKSVILCDGEYADRIYISGLSTDSIKKRTESEKGMKILWKK